MKRISVLLAFAMLLGFGLQAQSDCGHKKSADKAEISRTATAVDQNTIEAAVKLASLDENIEQRVNDENGEVTFVRKKTCAHSGKVSFVNVAYDAESAQFVNVSPKDMNSGKKGCCAAGAKAGKGCCAKKASAGEGCGSKKASTEASSTDNTEKVKLVKAEKGS